MTPHDRQDLPDPRLHAAIHSLRVERPDFSASVTIVRSQRRALIAIASVAALAVVVAPAFTLTVICGLCIVLYVATLTYRLVLLRDSLHHRDVVDVPDAVARAAGAADLPTYTVIVPAYREPELLQTALDHLEALDYPRRKLQILLLLEADDTATIAAAHRRPRRGVDIVLVPPSEPRTKPKACNYALAEATGELLTIFDVEDRPDPLQLRRAAIAFRALPPSVASLQARLDFYNADQNIITRWFSIEYRTWFTQYLPGLVHRRAPVPLGGTSTHFRRRTLDRLGAWDPFNVTEDADLGIRLHRAGYRTYVLASTTQEEANSDFVNWAKQRSRWYKGYLQTWLVHMRDPRRLHHELGTWGFLGFNLFVGGTPILALLNPMFWALTAIWFIGRPTFIAALFPTWIYYLGLACWLGGNFAFAYSNLLVAHESDDGRLLSAALLSPLYWVMMSMAAIKAVLQLVIAPSFWEKTRHGLERPAAGRARAA